MAPEQVEGKTDQIDARTDIFAFGALVYEMATARKAFEGKSQASLIAKILETDPPPMSSLQPMTPPSLDRIVKTCLAKDPDDRWQTARDLVRELKWASEADGQQDWNCGGFANSKSRSRPAVADCRRSPSHNHCRRDLVAKLQTARAGNVFSRTGFVFRARHSDFAERPHGSRHGISGVRTKSVIWIYEVGSQDAKPLADTEDASFPFWSADGKSLGFFADGKLKKLDIEGGTVQTLCDAPSGRGGTWNKDGVILFTPSGQLGGGLYRIAASGGTPTLVSSADKSLGEQSQRWPFFLPDGKHFLYVSFDRSGGLSAAIYVGSLDSNDRHLLTKATGNAIYAAPGYVLYYRDKTLFAQHFDLNKLTLSGEPAPILTEVEYLPRLMRASFAASDGGLLVAQNSSAVALSQLIWFDRKGNQVGVVGKPDVFANVSIAPDGKSVAVDRTDTGNQNTDVWIYQLQGDGTKRVTFDPAIDAMPVWSPDASRLAFASSRQNVFDLYLKNADGAQAEKPVEQGDVDEYPNNWSKDGKYLLYVRGKDLWFLTFPDLKSSLFLKATAHAEEQPAFSGREMGGLRVK